MEVTNEAIENAFSVLKNLQNDETYMNKIKDLLPESFGNNTTDSDFSTISIEEIQKKLKSDPEIVKKAGELIKDIGMNKDYMEKIGKMLKENKGLQPDENDTSTKKIVCIGISGKMKTRYVTHRNKLFIIKECIHCDDPMEIPCSRVCIGPLESNTIRLWYNPNRVGKNKKISKIVGFPICGEVVFEDKLNDLDTTTLEAAFKRIC
jgi:hypothetical protein